jgi:mRNA interferase MazF
MKQYEIWWLELPPPVDRRPVLILTRTDAIPHVTRLLVAEVTTRVRAIPQEVRLGRKEGLPRASVANLDAIRSVPVSVIRSPIGAISAARTVDVKRALGHVLRWPELTSS